jgi:hypothetical protein
MRMARYHLALTSLLLLLLLLTSSFAGRPNALPAQFAFSLTAVLRLCSATLRSMVVPLTLLVLLFCMVAVIIRLSVCARLLTSMLVRTNTTKG